MVQTHVVIHCPITFTRWVLVSNLHQGMCGTLECVPTVCGQIFMFHEDRISSNSTKCLVARYLMWKFIADLSDTAGIK